MPEPRKTRLTVREARTLNSVAHLFVPHLLLIEAVAAIIALMIGLLGYAAAGWIGEVVWLVLLGLTFFGLRTWLRALRRPRPTVPRPVTPEERERIVQTQERLRREIDRIRGLAPDGAVREVDRGSSAALRAGVVMGRAAQIAGRAAARSKQLYADHASAASRPPAEH